MVTNFGSVVRQIYQEKILKVKENFPDCDVKTIRQMAQEWTEDEVAFRARELMEIWEDTDNAN